MKTTKEVKDEIKELVSLLIGMTPTGEERNRICEINIALMELDNPKPAVTDDVLREQMMVGDWMAVNQFERIGDRFNYWLMVPKGTKTAVVVRDESARLKEIRPVKSLKEYLSYEFKRITT